MRGARRAMSRTGPRCPNRPAVNSSACVKRRSSNCGPRPPNSVRQFAGTTRDLESAEHSLAAIPDDADVAQHIRRLQETTKELAVLEDRAKRLDEEIGTLQSQRNDLQQKLLARKREDVERELADEQAARMVKLTIRTQDTMRQFLSRATAAKIDRLSQRVTESFRFLLRKKTLVHQVQIDAATFAIHLFDNAGQAIPKHRLSEGEKQVFAIWGSGQASPRPLPAIIDTPMARWTRSTASTSSSATSPTPAIKSSSSPRIPRWTRTFTPNSSRTLRGRTTWTTTNEKATAREVLLEVQHPARRAESPMTIKQIRLSSQAREQLIRLKTRTGIGQWNILCRWAFCLSLREPTPPTPIDVPADSNVEMTWPVFAGEHHELYLAPLKELAATGTAWNCPIRNSTANFAFTCTEASGTWQVRTRSAPSRTWCNFRFRAPYATAHEERDEYCPARKRVTRTVGRIANPSHNPVAGVWSLNG